MKINNSIFLVIFAILIGCMGEYGTEYGGFLHDYDAAGGNDVLAYDSVSRSDGANVETIGECTDSYCIQVCRNLGYAEGVCTNIGTCSCSGTIGQNEECGDGLDNDEDGQVDENCTCSPLGSTQLCYSGPPQTRGVGECTDGVQTCVGEMEFFHWSACEGETVPAQEICDLKDNDCNRIVDDGCSTECFVEEFGTEINCNDGKDNDCDGLIDCNDPECPPCCEPVPEVCDNGVDDDCDGLADCLDPNCLNRTEDCRDGKDNDCDGLVDCADPDCRLDPNCSCPSGHCTCCVPGTWRYCDTPTYCSWGRQECLPDGTWGYCSEVPAPSGCGGYYYNPSCCVSIGACCQNYPYDNTSIGNCTGISAECSV